MSNNIYDISFDQYGRVYAATELGISILNTSFSSQNSMKNLSIFPNPFTEHTSIEFSSDISSKYLLELFDISGKLVFHKEPKTNSKFILNKGKLNAGLYILKLSDGANTFHQKLVIK